MPKKGLGRGLDALIPSADLTEGQPVLQLRPDEIQPNPFQPRETITDDSIQELVESVRTYGVLQPLIVRSTVDGYQLIAGERRWRAATAAGVATVPCLVQEVSDEQALQMALVENLQREDLTPIEAARGYRQLIDQFGMTQGDVALAVGSSRTAVSNALRLLSLPAEIQLTIQHRTLSEGHARALMALNDEKQILALWKTIIQHRLSVRETERAVRKRLQGPKKRKPATGEPPAQLDAETADLEESLRKALGTKVHVRPRADGGGTITIEYYDPDDLESMVRTLELVARIS